jgi:hypothetical protein
MHTPVAGLDVTQLDDPVWLCDIHLYYPELPALKNVPICTAGTEWVDPNIGISYLLVLNECLYLGDRLRHTLLCPNQMQLNGLIVQDTPTMFDPTSTDSIFDPVTRMHIPFYMKGAMSCLVPMHQLWKRRMTCPLSF